MVERNCGKIFCKTFTSEILTNSDHVNVAGVVIVVDISSNCADVFAVTVDEEYIFGGDYPFPSRNLVVEFFIVVSVVRYKASVTAAVAPRFFVGIRFIH